MQKWKPGLVVGLCAVALGAVQQARHMQTPLMPAARLAPTTQSARRPLLPATRTAIRAIELPPAFRILMSRSIFSSSGKPALGGQHRPTAPEAGMALRGVVFDEASFVAFVEDTAAHRTLQLRAGDPLCAGCVRQINLDGMSFECHGKLTHVRVGQNLLGAALPPPAPPRPAPSGPPGPRPGPMPSVAARSAKGPVFGIGPDGQRIREYSQERRPRQ